MKKYIIIFMLIITAKLYSQWEFVGLDSIVVRQVQVFGDTIWAGTAVHTTQSQISGLYRSTNKGKDWIQIDTVLSKGGIGSLNFHPTNHNIIYIVKAINSPYGGSGTPFKSINGGKTWTGMGLDNYLIKWFHPSPFNENKFYAVDALNNEVYKSVDGGDTWSLIGEFPASSHGRFVAFNFSLARDSLLFAFDDVQFYQAFYKSTDDGYSWHYVGTPPLGITPEISTDNKLDCRIYFESYFITDNCGSTWNQVDSIDYSLTSRYLSLYIDTVNSKLYVAKTTGIYVSEKQTINWQKLSGTESLPLQGGSRPGFQSADLGRLKNIFVMGKTMYVGTLSGIYKKADITDVKDGNTFENISYSLSQNYPNPFNPKTIISYTLQVSGHTTLKVYDILGREVAALVNKEQSAGNYEVEFDGSKLSSGIYIYSIRVYSPGRAGNYAASKKMALTK